MGDWSWVEGYLEGPLGGQVDGCIWKKNTCQCCPGFYCILNTGILASSKCAVINMFINESQLQIYSHADPIKV